MRIGFVAMLAVLLTSTASAQAPGEMVAPAPPAPVVPALHRSGRAESPPDAGPVIERWPIGKMNDGVTVERYI